MSCLMCTADCLLLCCVSSELALLLPAGARNELADKPGPQPLLSSVFPGPVSGFRQLVPLIQAPGRRRRGERGSEGETVEAEG